MHEVKRLGLQLQAASSAGVPSELLAIILTTSNPNRLQELHQKASIRLLQTHKDVLQRPASTFALQERTRRKHLLDLIRARISAIGARKPSVDKMLQLMDTVPATNIVEIRKAA